MTSFLHAFALVAPLSLIGYFVTTDLRRFTDEVREAERRAGIRR